MAAMDQQKLNNMCTQLNNSAERYVNSVSTEVKNLIEAFNNNWVSTSAQELATEIQDCLSSLASRITNRFSTKNEGIKDSVYNFNAIEGENIVYNGFSFGTPTTTMKLNATLANGKLGVADGADLNAINEPMSKLVSEVCEELDNIKKTVVSCDAFSEVEQETLISSVDEIKTTFTNDMTETQNDLKSRMSGEMDIRAKLDSANISNLGA